MTDTPILQQVRFGPCLACGKAAFSCVCVPRPEAPGWPDEARPGVPLNPERDGWHWLVMVSGARPVPQHWTAGTFGVGWSALSTVGAGQRYQYLGPCLTPTEHAAALAAMLEKAFNDGGQEALLGALHPEFGSEWREDGVIGKAVAAAKAEGIREGMEQAAGIAKALGDQWHGTPAEDAARECYAAITAAMKETQG